MLTEEKRTEIARLVYEWFQTHASYFKLDQFYGLDISCELAMLAIEAAEAALNPLPTKDQ